MNAPGVAKTRSVGNGNPIRLGLRSQDATSISTNFKSKRLSSSAAELMFVSKSVIDNKRLYCNKFAETGTAKWARLAS